MSAGTGWSGLRRPLLAAAAVLGVIGVVTALFSIPVAVAALAASWLCGLGWLVLVTRGMSARLRVADDRRARARARRERAHDRDRAVDQRRAIRRVERRGKRLAARLNQQARVEQLTAERVRLLRKEVYQVLVSVQRTPSVTLELNRVYSRLVKHEKPMPELGDWAMTATTLVWLLDQIADGSVRTILECGSGSSTVWFATALAERGGEGKVVALESSAGYAEETRAKLAQLGLQDRAEVIHAPLVDTAVPGRDNQRWFDVSGLPDIGPVDLLFVDGPIGGTAPQARYPAFPLLADRLAPGAIVVLDDTGRPHEAAIVKAWQAESFAGRGLREIRRLDRAVAFTTTTREAYLDATATSISSASAPSSAIPSTTARTA